MIATRKRERDTTSTLKDPRESIVSYTQRATTKLLNSVTFKNRSYDAAFISE